MAWCAERSGALWSNGVQLNASERLSVGRRARESPILIFIASIYWYIHFDLIFVTLSLVRRIKFVMDLKKTTFLF